MRMFLPDGDEFRTETATGDGDVDLAFIMLFRREVIRSRRSALACIYHTRIGLYVEGQSRGKQSTKGG
jgi:hypothetical protein